MTNIADLLKDCPIGTELYSPLCGDCRLLKVYNGLGFDVINDTNDVFNFSYDGRYNLNGECCIFPSKEQRDWSKFQRPFVDGDILICGLGVCENNPFIFKGINGFGNAKCYCAINCFKQFIFNCDNWAPINDCRFATPEEKQELFQAIKDNGYRWNAETKTLEELIEPKFKVGDKIKYRTSGLIHRIVEITEDSYVLDNLCSIPISIEYMYILVSDIKPKFKVGDRIRRKTLD